MGCAVSKQAEFVLGPNDTLVVATTKATRKRTKQRVKKKKRKRSRSRIRRKWLPKRRKNITVDVSSSSSDEDGASSLSSSRSIESGYTLQTGVTSMTGGSERRPSALLAIPAVIDQDDAEDDSSHSSRASQQRQMVPPANMKARRTATAATITVAPPAAAPQTPRLVRYAIRFTPVMASVVSSSPTDAIVRRFVQQILRRQQQQRAPPPLQCVAAPDTDNDTTVRQGATTLAHPAESTVAHRTERTAAARSATKDNSVTSSPPPWCGTTWEILADAMASMCCLAPATGELEPSRRRELGPAQLYVPPTEEHGGAVVERSLRDVVTTSTILIGSTADPASDTSFIRSNRNADTTIMATTTHCTAMVERAPSEEEIIVRTGATVDQLVVRDASDVLAPLQDTTLACPVSGHHDAQAMRAPRDVTARTGAATDERAVVCRPPRDLSMLGEGQALVVRESRAVVVVEDRDAISGHEIVLAADMPSEQGSSSRMDPVDIGAMVRSSARDITAAARSRSSGPDLEHATEDQALVIRAPRDVVYGEQDGNTVGSSIVCSTGQELVLSGDERAGQLPSLSGVDPVDAGQGAAVLSSVRDVVVAPCTTLSSRKSVADVPEDQGNSEGALVLYSSSSIVAAKNESHEVVALGSREVAIQEATAADTGAVSCVVDDSCLTLDDMEEARASTESAEVSMESDQEKDAPYEHCNRDLLATSGNMGSTGDLRSSCAALTHRKVAGRRVIQPWNSDSSSSGSDVHSRTRRDIVPIERALLARPPKTARLGDPGSKSKEPTAWVQQNQRPKTNSTWDSGKSRQLRALLLETTAALVQSRHPEDELDFEVADDGEGNVECQICSSEDSSLVETRETGQPWTANEWAAKQGHRLPGYYLVHQKTRDGAGRLKAVFARERAPRSAVGFWCPPPDDDTDDEEAVDIIHHSKLFEDSVGCDVDESKFCLGWRVFLQMAARQSGSAIQFVSATAECARMPIYVYGCNGVHKTKLDLDQGLVDVFPYQSFFVTTEELELPRSAVVSEQKIERRGSTCGQTGLFSTGNGCSPSAAVAEQERRHPSTTTDSGADGRSESGYDALTKRPQTSSLQDSATTTGSPWSNDIENDIPLITSLQNRKDLPSTSYLSQDEDGPALEGLVILSDDEAPSCEAANEVVLQSTKGAVNLDTAESPILVGDAREDANRPTGFLGKIQAWLPKSKETNESLLRADKAIALADEPVVVVATEDTSISETEVFRSPSSQDPMMEKSATKDTALKEWKGSRKSVRFGHGSTNVAEWAAEWDQPGYYLVHDNREGGRLKVKFRNSRVPKHSIGFWCTQDGLRSNSELCLGVLQHTVGCNTDDDKYVEGWSDFVSMAVQEKGSIISFTSKRSVPVEVYGFRPTQTTPSKLNIQNGLVDVSRFDYIAVTLVGEGTPPRNPVPKIITVTIPATASDPASVPSSWCAVPFCSATKQVVADDDSDTTSEAWDAPNPVYALENVYSLDEVDAPEADYETEDSTVLSAGSDDSLVVLYQALPWGACCN